MTLPTVFWAAALTQVPAETSAEPWRPHEAECHRREDAAEYAEAGDACRHAFEAVPAGPLAFNKRSLFAFSAVRLYKKARKAGSDLAPLCSAAALLRAFEAQLGSLPARDRPRDRADVADALRTIEPQITGACAEPAAELMEVGRSSVKPRPAIVRPPPQTDTPPPRPAKRRALRIAGGAALGAGFGLGGAAIAMLVRGAAMQSQVNEINATYPSGGAMIPDTEAQRFYDAKTHGEQADRLALGFGVPAIGLVLAGVVSLAIDVHRERSDRRLALQPGPAGIRLSLEF